MSSQSARHAQPAARIATSILLGSCLPALALAMMRIGIEDETGMFLSPMVLATMWWTSVPLGVVATISISRRMWPGAVTGVFSVFAFHLSMVMTQPLAERAAALASPRFLVGALTTVALPWGIGTLLGWAAIAKPRVRNDGVALDRQLGEPAKEQA